MSDYLSKYAGEEIDERLERVDYLIPKSVIVNDFIHSEADHVASAYLSNRLKAMADELFERFVNNDLDQTIQGRKTFGDAALFSSGLTVPSGQTIIVATDPVDIRGAVAKQYVDKRAVDFDVAGRGLKFMQGVGNSANFIDIDLDAASGLKFTADTVAGKLRLDINGTVEAGYANPTDELIIWSVADGALRKIKKSALLGDLTKSLRIRGTWDPTTNTLSGDLLNGVLTKGAAPIAASGDTPVGYQYFVSADGLFDLVDDATPEQFRIGDSVVWSGSAWILLRDQSKVVSFTGKQGTSRQGAVTAANGDYSADMVSYSRPTGRTDVQATSLNVLQAINDLDDKKVSRTNASFYGTTVFPNGTKAALAITFAGSSTSGVYYDGTSVMITSNGTDIYGVKDTGLQTLPGMRYSVNGKGYLTDINESGTFSTVLYSLTQLRLKGSTVRLMALDDTDYLTATSGGVALKASNVEVLSVSSAAVTASQPVQAPNGVVGKPSLSFTNNQSTGFWSNGTDMVVSVSGFEIGRWLSSGLLMKKPLAMGTDTTSAQQINFIADGTSPRDAVNLGQLQSAVAATYLPDNVVSNITASTACQVFDITAANGARYLVSAKRADNARQISEILVCHDGTNVYVSEYGQVGADLMIISFVLSGNNCIMNVAPVTGTIEVKVKTIALM